MVAIHNHRNGLLVFALCALLVLAQVSWWANVFVTDVRVIADLKTENLKLRAQSDASTDLTPALAEIEHQAYHRRLMFLSESTFFALITCLSLFLLYRALHRERKSQAIQRNFIEVVTHESKTPLTALKLRLESTLEKARSPKVEVERDLSLALAEVRRLSSVFDKTMSLNRLEREALAFEEICLSEVVRDVVRRLDPLLRDRDVKVTLDLDEDVFVNGDVQGLQNSLQSLMENAVLYNVSAEKRVDLRLRGLGTRALLSIRDNGPGISENDRARIFERFYRGETGKGAAGTGLGLYLCKTMVEAHHGQLRLVEGSASGAEFEIDLPRGSGAA